MERIRFYAVLICLLFTFLNITGQVTSIYKPLEKNVATPTFPTMPSGHSLPNVNRNNPHDPATIIDMQQRNAAIVREVEEHEMFLAESRRQRDILMLTKSGFPSLSHNEGASNFYSAFDEIHGMLKGDSAMNLGRAIFLVENAYYGNKYDYNDYRQSIKEVINLCNMKIKEDKLDGNDNLVKNMMLFRIISDTLKIRDRSTGKNLYHYPIKYDYEDYHSKINYDSHFVTSLMRTGKGQCYSMPLYYLVLAEEIGAEAYWSFSPRHTFIKIQDDEGMWRNLELTCKAILSDAHYMNNSYIKAEAIRQRIYLEPMDKKNTIAQMLTELARGYYERYGLDDFYLKCADTAMEYLDNDLDPLMLKSVYETRLTLTLVKLLGTPPPDELKDISPETYGHYQNMLSLYGQIDDLGYEELPENLYARWLDYIAKEKAKSEKLPSIFLRLKKE